MHGVISMVGPRKDWPEMSTFELTWVAVAMNPGRAEAGNYVLPQILWDPLRTWSSEVALFAESPDGGTWNAFCDEKCSCCG